MAARRAFLAFGLVLASLLAGCSQRPDAGHQKVTETLQPEVPFLDLRGMAPTVVAWDLGVESPAKAIEVWYAPRSAPSDAKYAFLETLDNHARQGTHPIDVPPGDWLVRLKVTWEDGQSAWSEPRPWSTPAQPSSPLVVDAGRDITVSDADGNGWERIVLAGRVVSAEGQALRGTTWSLAGREVASTLVAGTSLPLGIHELRLNVTYAAGATVQSTSDSLRVEVTPNRPPIVSTWTETAAVSDANGDGRETVWLRGAADDPDAAIESVAWREDGVTLLQAREGNATFAVGSHFLTFEAKDAAGDLGQAAVHLQVLPNRPPVAMAGPDQSVIDGDGDGEAVVLDARASRDPEGARLSYRWTVDGGFVSSDEVAHWVASHGKHDVVLEVTDLAGEKATDQAVIVVRASLPPIAAVLATSCDLMRCEFDGAGSTGEAPLTLRWSLGDGTEATGSSVRHTYSSEGLFPVRLEVEDAVGRKATAWTNVTTRITRNVFEDGAETAGDWTRASWYHQRGFVQQPPDLGLSDHPNGTWAPTTAHARTGARSWTAPYPDQINASMTSLPIRVPDDPTQPHALTYWLRGGVENNPGLGVDGLHIYVQRANGALREEQYVTDDFPSWQAFTVPLDAYLGEEVRFVFSFQSDGYCSQGNGGLGRALPAMAGLFSCDPSSYEGYFIDDIAVT